MTVENLPAGEAPRDCMLCPRLVEFRQENQEKFPDYFNGAVPSFGDRDCELLVVGLAPGLHGANRTGRPFTGDYAGDLLYPTLVKFGFAAGNYGQEIDDGLTLNRAMITNAVRCVPPQNKPTTTEEKTCRPFLVEQIDSLSNVRVLLALGLVAHNAVLTTFGVKKSAYKFAHGARHQLNDKICLIDSYHCSRYNTNTGRLTTEMFEDVFRLIEAQLA
ncbi:uracil-DNA glycosylase [Emcibacter nanhaiensis]|uniref:Type-5 uracil-DNA glycosylase n=1 Tax=Emcibacter nanhaiensis TaxID=1505037 RepID=A0A501PRM5_9PROT|nr:uracil-DNA glycosylase [Emcibacter nanhaiensis]TPD62614.1 uracil-DNA glycosylase [Emcibacter nanhaiensis]